MRHYGLHEGLPSPQVRAITQGADGRLWIAGPAGVAAYDGQSWQEFGLSSGLRWGDQRALVWDDAGRLVAVSHRPPHYASRRQGEAWESLEVPPDEAPAVLHDVAYPPGGPLLYATEGGLLFAEGVPWQLLEPTLDPASPAVRSLAVWQGGVALATDVGVVLWHGRDGVPRPLLESDALPAGRVEALAAERSADGDDALLWVVGDGWLGTWDGETFRTLGEHLAFRSVGGAPSRGEDGEAGVQSVRALADGLGGLYLAGVEATSGRLDPGAQATGLVYFHPSLGLQALGPAEGVAVGRVAALFRDREDNVWVGGERGLTKIVSRRFGNWDRRLGLLDDGVYSAYERRDGTVVLGHRGGVSILSRSDGRTTVDTRSLPLSSPDQRRIEPVRDMVEDENGVLWLAAESAGVLSLPPLGVRPRRFTSGAGPDDAFPGDATALTAAGGRLWVGTDRGVFVSAAARAGSTALRFDPVPSSPDGSFRPVHVRQMEADAEAVMVAAADGVYRLAVPRAASVTTPARRWTCRGGGACNSTFGLLRRSDREWWVGTAAGLFRLDLQDPSSELRPVRGPEIAARPDPASGAGSLLDEPIFFLLEATTGSVEGAGLSGVGRSGAGLSGAGRSGAGRSGAAQVWLGTGDGVVGLSADGSGRWTTSRVSVEDGLAGRETHRAAAFRDRDGRLWMGTDSGVSVYDHRFDRGARRPPMVELISIEAGGEVFGPRDEIRLSASGNDLEFHFRAVSLVDEDRVLLRRMLAGEDEDWSEPFRNSDRLNYSNLPPGTYRMHLQASGAGGDWSPSATSAPVVVRAPFWRTSWFLAALVLSAACLTWGLVTLVSQRRYFHRLREEVAERTSELQASEDRYRKTFKAIDDGVVATDGDGRVQLLNPTARRLTGWSEDEARGRPVDEVMNVYLTRDADLSPLDAASRDDSRQGERERMSLLGEKVTETIGPTHTAVMESRDGTRRHIEMSTSPIASRDQGVTGLVFAFRDVTRRRRVEEELSRTQKLEAVGILAGGIAHDFNNLLTVLMGNLSLIHDSIRLDPDTAKALADAETALVRARDLTQQLLTFSRGGAPVRETASVSEVLRDSASFVLRGSKVRFDLDLAPDLWLVDIDAGQISQVMQNLLLNADQAMPGGGTVYISARNVREMPAAGRAAGARAAAAGPDPSRGRFVRIDVRDDGIGIPPDLKMRIFDPYFSTKEEGRGLGLASAYAIVKKHDGLLTVDSEPGRGTTFSIYLPGSPQGLRESAGRDPSGPIPTGGLPGFAGRRILLMDDDRVVRRTAGAMLERLGCEVVHAEHGAKALALYEDALDEGRRFDAVLMDLTVPGGMGGQEAVVRLRALDEQAVAIVYSGYSTDPVLAQYTDYGFDGRLSKPFRIRELAAVLEEVLHA